MSFGVTGNYFFTISIAGRMMPFEPQMFREISITQDIERLVPVFRICSQDAGGNFSHLLPYDKSSSEVVIECGKDPASNEMNRFVFRALRRSPQVHGMFEMEGMLDVPGLFNQTYSRSWSGTIKTTLEDIAKEVGINSNDIVISPSLNYRKVLVQPNWTDAKWLEYLKKRLVGRNGEFGWVCFIRNYRGLPTFVFRSLKEIFSDPVKYNFIVGEAPFQDHLPLCDIQVHDNSGLLSSFGPKVQTYQYYDYTAGTFHSSESVSIDDQPSLTQFHLVDKSETAEGTPILFGRSNGFNSDFEGPAQTAYSRRLLSDVEMWAVSLGLANVVPGDIVKIIFAEALVQGKMFEYQHSGYWMVKRVVHLFDTTFVTRLNLVRTGIDTSSDTSLTVAQDRKR